MISSSPKFQISNFDNKLRIYRRCIPVCPAGQVAVGLNDPIENLSGSCLFRFFGITVCSFNIIMVLAEEQKSELVS